MSPLRLLFAGSPAAAVPSLKALDASAHRVVSVVTREDAAQGRRRILTGTPVANAAAESGIHVIKANHLGSVEKTLVDLAPDLGVIVAYGGLVKQPLLTAPRLGWINLHFSLLPRWRGAAPVQRALIAGDEITGATVFRLVEELDAGDVYGQLTQWVGANETAGHLLGELSRAGAQLLLRVVDALADGTARAEPQWGDVTLAPKLTLADGALDWRQPASVVYNRFRGVTPEPGARAELEGVELKILDAVIARDDSALSPGVAQLRGRRVLVGTVTDPIEIVTLQPAGKRVMPAADWWRGRKR